MLRRLALLLALCVLVLPATGAAAQRPPEFSAPPVDQVLDLHGDPLGARLVIFMAGNQYMVMPPLLNAFRRKHPEVRPVRCASVICSSLRNPTFC